MRGLIKLIFFVGFFLTAALISTPAISADAGSNQATGAALTELRSFLFDASARRTFANGNSEATAVNNFLEAFPGWAQQELLDIVMLIVQESGTDATKHASAFQSGGAQGAMDSFSPAVRGRVDNLMKKLATDPNFNQPKNISKMRRLIPALKHNQS
jgi:hypothetical protein